MAWSVSKSVRQTISLSESIGKQSASQTYRQSNILYVKSIRVAGGNATAIALPLTMEQTSDN